MVTSDVDLAKLLERWEATSPDKRQEFTEQLSDEEVQAIRRAAHNLTEALSPLSVFIATAVDLYAEAGRRLLEAAIADFDRLCEGLPPYGEEKQDARSN